MSARRSFLIGLLVYLLIAGGVATLNRGLLVLAFPLVFYLGASLIYRPAPFQVRITRRLSDDYVAAAAPVTLEVTVTNEGSDLNEVRIADTVPAGLEATGDTTTVVSLPAGASHTLSYRVAGPRGTYRFRDIDLSAQDHLGLFRRRHTFAVPAKLSILPAVPHLRRVMIRPLRTRGFAGPIPSREGGTGTDFFGVREYHPGDSPRWINWRMSARTPQLLYTNQFEQERIADVGLILDARERTDVQVNGTSLFEYGVEATAALADTFLADGNRVGLLIYGRGLERTFPGYGKHQRQRLLYALSQAQTGDSQVFDSLDYLPARFFPAKSQLVLISPVCADDPPVLTRLRARGYQVIVVSPDPVDFEARSLPPSPARDLAARIAHAERMLWVRKLQRVGIPVVNWRVNQSLDATVHAAMRKAAPQMARQQVHE